MIQETVITAHKKKKIPKQDVTEYMVTSPVQMEDLLKGNNVLKCNKAAGLNDILCEQIKNFGTTNIRWVL